ncbi:MAG: hypothetical protein HUU46_14295 [Candidatus Hydrogenedentes bacterium]|nr:hypothetical protein [Candidatus Hydrogenedentota bacterium]
MSMDRMDGMDAMDQKEPEVRRTALGSPCSPVWDEGHVALVEATEVRLGKRICGARTFSGNPCTLEPNHANGRCKFHGGFDLTGAQPGNRNAVVHGLYSRAIQTCGEHCPLWKSCPCAGPDVAKLDPKERPRCPYEVAAFNTAETDVRAQLAAKRAQALPAGEEAQPLDQHVAAEIAMVRVVFMRAAAALAAGPVVDATIVTGEKRGMTTTKPSAYLQAFLRVSSEHRRYVQLYRLTECASAPDAVLQEQDRRARLDTSLLAEDLAGLEREAPVVEGRAWMYVRAANKHARAGHHDDAKNAFNRAAFLSPRVAERARDATSQDYMSLLDRILPPRNRAAMSAEIVGVPSRADDS